MEGVDIREVADFHGAGGASAEVGVVDRLSLCFRHQAPQGIAAVGLSAFLQGCGHHPLDPGRFDAWVFRAHHLTEIGRGLHVAVASATTA